MNINEFLKEQGQEKIANALLKRFLYLEVEYYKLEKEYNKYYEDGDIKKADEIGEKLDKINEKLINIITRNKRRYNNG